MRPENTGPVGRGYQVDKLGSSNLSRGPYRGIYPESPCVSSSTSKWPNTQLSTMSE